MTTPSFEVDLVFQEEASGSTPYTFTYLQEIEDPKEGMKHNKIDGTRGDGCIIIPGGKRSQKLIVKGLLRDDGYEDLTTLMDTMRSSVTTDSATLTLKHRPIAGGNWTTDWSYTVRRVDEIKFEPSFRIDEVRYEVSFWVTAY